MATQSYAGSSREMTAHGPGVIKVSIGDFWSAGDKGRSNQPIPGMGRARHLCAVKSFALAHASGVPTHFLREVEDGFLVNEFSVPTHEPLSGETVGEVFALEWIWRRYLKGSLWERVKNGELDPIELGYPKGYMPKEGELLPRMRMECTTKYEPLDRKLSDEEAIDLAKLTLAEWDEAWQLMQKQAEATDRHALGCGFMFPDGKGEIGRFYKTGKLVMVDTFGTPDENRIIRLSDGEIFSKDLIRNYLKEVGYAAKLRAAQKAFPTEPDHWPDYPTLPAWLVELVGGRYGEFATAYDKLSIAV